MKNKKVGEQYDQIYTHKAADFNGEVLPLVKVLSELLNGGEVLDLGAGVGRNSLFLALKGYKVTATDISAKGIELLRQKAKEVGVEIDTKVLDIAEQELEKEFDAIVCVFTLHHLTTEDAETAIQKIQQHTKSGGYNVITAFTKNGDFYKNKPTTPYFFLNNKEHLESYYSGWSILKSFEREGLMRVIDENKERQINTFAGLLAQKEWSCVFRP